MTALHSPSVPPHTPPQTAPHTETFSLWPCVAVLVVCMASVVILGSWPRTGLPVVIMFPPWFSLDQMDARITQAGGALVDFGAFKGVVVGLSPDPHFAERLYGNGALLALDGSFAGGLCAVPQG